MVSRKDATNYAKLVGLSQFDRLTRVEPHSSYDLPTPAWKAGVLPNKLMRHIRAPPQTFRQEGALHVGCAALDKLLAIKHECGGVGKIRTFARLSRLIVFKTTPLNLLGTTPYKSCKHENSFFTVTPLASCISLRF